MADDAEGQVIDEETAELDAETQARRRLALAQIRQYGDPILRMRARDVSSFDEDLERLVTRMRQLMTDARGVGLAATQVGILERVFVFQNEDEEVIAVVNPELTKRGDETATEDEGCLSLQGITVPVERHLSVTLSAKDPEGRELELELEGHPARVVQHELDHLDGTLILDRTSEDARKEALAVLRPRPILAAG
jgi:peptide deformylase